MNKTKKNTKPAVRSIIVQRHPTLPLQLGSIKIGGGAPISVQTMTKTLTRNAEATIKQILELEQAGCDIIRVAVPDMEAARAISPIRRAIHIPLVADIHFDYRLALAAIAGGADGLRLNPGNIGSKLKIREVVKAAAEKNLPIRIGVNSGSLEKDILAKHGAATAHALVESALRHARILEDLGHHAIKISVKASDVNRTVEAYRLLSKATDYPLHLGVTEAGTLINGAVRSSIALGILLAEGIGDTIRVSLSAPPANEVRVGREILRSLGLGAGGINVIACPTCGRAQMDVMKLARAVEEELEKLEIKESEKTATIKRGPPPPWKTACFQQGKDARRRDRGTFAISSKKIKYPQIKKWPTVAVMGCVVNGPGEAREADIALVCGKNQVFLYIAGTKVAVLDAKSAPAVVAQKALEFCSRNLT